MEKSEDRRTARWRRTALVVGALWCASTWVVTCQGARLAASVDDTFAMCIQAARDRDRMTVAAANALVTIALMRGDDQEIREAEALLREVEASAVKSTAALDRATARLTGARPADGAHRVLEPPPEVSR